MLPPKNDQRWKDLLTGKTTHQFKAFSAGMCISRLCREVKKDPANMTTALDEIYAFFQKYETLAADDLAAIFG